MEANCQAVSHGEAERLRESVRSGVADPRAGIFGPNSLTWKVNRESALFLGAGRAALLQLAHPWVAAALDRHSNLRADPVGRFHGTFRVVFTMIFGTLEQALAASRRVYNLHTRIQGEVPESVAAFARGSRYQANEVNALVWVFATLVQSALLAYNTVLPSLTGEERETYYAESKKLAALFGIPPESLPSDWHGLERYVDGMTVFGVLGVTSLSRDLARRVMHGRGSWMWVPSWYRALTASWMPEPLRCAFGLAYGVREQAAEARARRRLPHVYGLLPGQVRLVGPYREAVDRLMGRRANLLTRASNRFWMGQPHMMFAQSERNRSR